MIRTIIASLLLCLLCITTDIQANEITSHTQSKLATSVIDINSATVEQLSQLKGIGKSKAQAIVAYRLGNGDFNSIDDLIKVKGIGKQIVAANKGRLKVLSN